MTLTPDNRHVPRFLTAKRKLWHDDVRPVPNDSWLHVRTNSAARWWLSRKKFDMVSLDHDMGYSGPLPVECEECGGSGYVSQGASLSAPERCPGCDGDGFHGGDAMYVAGGDEDNGMRLVEWMVFHDRVPDRVEIHSWNPDGAKDMFSYLMGKKHRLSNDPMVIVRRYARGNYR